MRDASGKRLNPANDFSRDIRIPSTQPITKLRGDERPIDELKEYFLGFPARARAHISDAYHYISERLKI